MATLQRVTSYRSLQLRSYDRNARRFEHCDSDRCEQELEADPLVAVLASAKARELAKTLEYVRRQVRWAYAATWVTAERLPRFGASKISFPWERMLQARK
jgi:hypothetical protein